MKDLKKKRQKVAAGSGAQAMPEKQVFERIATLFARWLFTPCTGPVSLVEAVTETAGNAVFGLLSPACSGLNSLKPTCRTWGWALNMREINILGWQSRLPQGNVEFLESGSLVAAQKLRS